MLRKTMLAFAAAAALGATALAPTSASAWGWHGGWHGGWGGWHGPRFRVFAGPVYAGPVYGGCLGRATGATPYPPAPPLIKPRRLAPPAPPGPKRHPPPPRAPGAFSP